MRDLFRDYGSAIGPTLAFVLGLLALAVKRRFDDVAARRDAERRVTKIVAMIEMSPPPQFQGPTAALSHVHDVITNTLSMSMFFDRLVSVRGALDAADKPVHDHAKPQTIIKFQQMRWHFDLIMDERKHFRKSSHSTDIPIEESFFNIEQSWRGMLDAFKSKEISLRYQVSSPPALKPG